ncbi:MAG: hypothetical protein M3P34_00215, partial [Actinomycetota bacterium]|nr:hypothetical protein [Actinomycetota bacterium]
LRDVDLAGNSLDPGVSDHTHATAPILYTRFDPVPPPAIVPRAPLAEGESVERLVIRSNFDQTAEEWAGAHPGYSAVNDRHVVPPKGSQQLAEAHGLFDGAIGQGADQAQVAAAYAVAIREAGRLDTAAGSTLVPGQLPPDAPDPDPNDTRPVPGAYLINAEPMFPLPYLPDPAGRGVAFRGLPGVDREHTREFSGTWPNLSPLVLCIREREGTVKPGECQETFLSRPGLDWDVAKRSLTVSLGKAETAVVRYSCYPGDALDHMAVWRRWLQPLEDPALRDLVVTGGHWMVSPFRELVLVHAVQQPLCPPNVRLRSSRRPGATYTDLRGRIMLSVKSTGQIDLHASWTDPIDSLSDVKPALLQGGGQVASLSVDSRLPEPAPWVDLPPEPDGTRPVPEDGGLPFGFPNVDRVVAAGFSLHDAEILMEMQRPVAHEFGDTRHRWVRYRPRGTTRFREYFPPAITQEPANISRIGDEVLVNVLSSARPEAPRVLYMVPSFRWVGGRAAPNWTTFTRTRTGGGLRVWMDRPWYSSGEGEKLAAVLWPPDRKPLRFFEKSVSQYGIDPAWTAAIPTVTLRPSDFANAVDTDAGLTLEEASKADDPEVRDATVSIAAFEPEYDEDRRLWFCDIDLSRKAAPSYFPFVRLALARYQCHSTTNAQKLSPVAQTDFAQLLPSRTLTVTFREERTLDVTVYGAAVTGPIRNRVEVTLEHHDGSIPGDLGWRRVPPSPGRPNPVHLSDGVPDISWIPPDIPTALRSTTDLRRSNERFQAQARVAIARESLPTMNAAEVVDLLDLRPGALGKLPKVPVVAIPGYELWSGPVPLPDPRANLGPLRLVVREFEHYTADDDVGRLDTNKEDPHITGRYLDRVVYADIVELPRS